MTIIYAAPELAHQGSALRPQDNPTSSIASDYVPEELGAREGRLDKLLGEIEGMWGETVPIRLRELVHIVEVLHILDVESHPSAADMQRMSRREIELRVQLQSAVGVNTLASAVQNLPKEVYLLMKSNWASEAMEKLYAPGT